VKSFFHEISLSTKKRTEVIDLTSQVEDAVSKSEIKNGFCIIHTFHTTAGIIVNENEHGLIYDIIRKVQEQFPREAGYQHDRIDDNADAHLASAFIGPSKIFPVKNSRILRGTWQSILFVEADGPRSRRVVLEVLGE